MEDLNIREMEQNVNYSLRYVDNIIKALEKAQKLSVADIAGGKMIISKAKYDAIDEANKNEETFEIWYRKLTQTPAYQTIDLNLRVEIAQSVKVMDIFFDNIAIDLYVQTKIGDVLKEARAVMEKLYEVKSTIRRVGK